MSMQADWNKGNQDTVNAVMERATKLVPQRIFLDFSGDLYTYADIDSLASKRAAGLKSWGVAPGDTVASILDNNVDAVVTWLAINKLGAISVPVNTAYKGEFLRHQLADSAARIVLTETDYAERLTAVASGLPNVEVVAIRGAARNLSDVPWKLMSFGELDTDSAEFRPHPVKPGDLSMLIYTSGTTGPSKGCMVSHNYVCNLTRQGNAAMGRQEADTLWTALPLFHLNCVIAVIGVAMVGARLVVYPRFSVSGFWPDIERSGANAVSLLGSMAPLLAEAPDNEASKRCFGQIRTVGAAPFPPDLKEKWRLRFGIENGGAPGYGLTEAAMVVSGNIGEPAPPHSSGKRNGDFEVLIVDDDDVEVPVGSPGEIIVRPKRPHVCFEGYWNKPAETLKIMRNMWLHTGDVGRFDENGYFYFLDRKKDYLRRRGENISSFEMESTFQSHPLITDVAVHAVLSALGEDDVKVTAVLHENAKLTEEELCRWSVDKLPYFAVPRYVEFRKDLPRNPTGKIMKYKLREEGCTPTTWDREKAGFKIQRR